MGMTCVNHIADHLSDEGLPSNPIVCTTKLQMCMLFSHLSVYTAQNLSIGLHWAAATGLHPLQPTPSLCLCIDGRGPVTQWPTCQCWGQLLQMLHSLLGLHQSVPQYRMGLHDLPVVHWRHLPALVLPPAPQSEEVNPEQREGCRTSCHVRGRSGGAVTAGLPA